MNKSELLDLIVDTQTMANAVSTMEGLKFKDKKFIKSTKKYLYDAFFYIRDEVADNSFKIIEKTAKDVWKCREELIAIEERLQNETLENEKTTEQNEEKTNKKKQIGCGVVIGASCICIAAAIIMIANRDDIKDKDSSLNQPDINDKPPVSDETNKPVKPNDSTELNVINAINLDDETMLYNYAISIKNALNDNTVSVEHIVDALRIANFDVLENQNIFTSAEEVILGMKTLGKVASEFGLDCMVKKYAEQDIYVNTDELNDVINSVAKNNVTIDNFAKANSFKGYDIYKIIDICINEIKLNNETSVYYGKVLNDLTARIRLSATLLEDCPISTLYTLTSIYNEHANEIVKLTTKEGSSIYGDSVSVDGYYGFTCVEEIRDFNAYENDKGELNEANELYSIYMDKVILNQGRKLN